MFMEIQKTVGMEFIQIETRQSGTTWYPGDEHDEESARAEHDGETIEEVGSIFGYGVRLSAPGYLDCTEWEVFPTAEEADARAAEIIVITINIIAGARVRRTRGRNSRRI